MNHNTKPREKLVPPDFPQGLLPYPIHAVATHRYTPRDVLELGLTRNQQLRILERKGDWWFTARTNNGDEGWVPSSYIRLLESPTSLDMSSVFATWYAEVEDALCVGKKEKLSKATFPWVPPELTVCEEMGCKIKKLDGPLGACVHDVEMLLKGSGKYEAEWLWRETLKWHPDRWVRMLQEGFKGEGLKAVGDLFAIVRDLADKERERAQKERS